MRVLLRNRVVALAVVGFMAAAASVFALGIDSTDKYSWGENIGWMNWGTSEGAVDVPESVGDLTGYVWGENIGWLSLNCSNTSSCGSVDFKVSRGGGQFTGYAWGENVGWVSFSCLNTASCATVDYRVSIATASGEFSGYAWGENIGWAVFNCSTTASCGTVDYRVKAATPTPTGGGGGTGGFLSPSPAPSSGPVSSTPITSPTASPPPFGTPSASPPPATPTGSPPAVSPTPSSGPLPIVISGISDALDRLMNALFGTGVGRVCEDVVGLAACATTALVSVAVALSLLAALAQGELWPSLLALLQVVGLRRKPRVWGVVYDSATKHPVPLAKVELLEPAGRVIEVRFADADGRYGFLASPESLGVEQLSVVMRASKSGFKFPSSLGNSGTDYVVYDRLYRGETVVIRKSEFVAYNVPMDPVSGRRVSISGLGRNIIGVTGDRVLAAGFVIGLVAVPLNIWLNPSPASWIIASIFVLANLFRTFGMYRPYGQTRDALTGRQLPFALVTMHDPLTGARIGFAVSDEHGRFILSGTRGADYDLVVYTPANISPQRTVRRRVRASSRMGRRGWVTLTIHV